MKRSLLALTALVAIAAFADQFQSAQYQLDSTNAFPTAATAGMKLSCSNGNPVQSLAVTVADFNDGGVDDDFIWLGNVQAHVYNITTRYPDGGAGWDRAPAFDITVDAGTATGAPIQAAKTRGITTYFAPTLPLPTTSVNGRLYFSTTGVLGNDAGTPRHTVLIEGRCE